MEMIVEDGYICHPLSDAALMKKISWVSLFLGLGLLLTFPILAWVNLKRRRLTTSLVMSFIPLLTIPCLIGAFLFGLAFNFIVAS